MIKSPADVKSATTAELVAFYNAATDSAIKKFQDRGTAERRVLALLSTNALVPVPIKAAPATSFPVKAPKKSEQKRSVAKKAKKGDESIKPAKKRSSKEHKGKFPSLSDAQRALWKDPPIREARCERSAVAVGEEEYRSVRAAFEELGLPMSQHIKFRGLLKEKGKLNAYGYDWEIIPLNY